MMRAAVAKGIDISTLPPPPPSNGLEEEQGRREREREKERGMGAAHTPTVADDRVECPHCSRKFNEKAP